jgi:hypothetical protein
MAQLAILRARLTATGVIVSRDVIVGSIDRSRHKCRSQALGRITDELAKRGTRKLARCYGDGVPLDLDVSPFDNSGTKKQGVVWTYCCFFARSSI